MSKPLHIYYLEFEIDHCNVLVLLVAFELFAYVNEMFETKPRCSVIVIVDRQMKYRYTHVEETHLLLCNALPVRTCNLADVCWTRLRDVGVRRRSDDCPSNLSPRPTTIGPEAPPKSICIFIVRRDHPPRPLSVCSTHRPGFDREITDDVDGRRPLRQCLGQPNRTRPGRCMLPENYREYCVRNPATRNVFVVPPPLPEMSVMAFQNTVQVQQSRNVRVHLDGNLCA